MNQQQHTQIVRDGRKKTSWRQRVCRCACIIKRKAASFLLRKDDVESLGFSPQNHSRFLSELHTHVHMFAVTTTPTSLSSSATRSLKNKKASSLSKRTKCSSIVVSSSSSSSSSKMDEKFDRREMLKNALVASVGVVATTPMPVSSFVRLVLPMISKRVFMYFVVFRLDHQKAEKETTRKRVCGFDLSLFSLVSRTRKVRKRSKNVLTKRFF